MYYTEAEAVIARHAMAPDPVTGNKMFTINKADCRVAYKKNEFLVPHRKDYYFWAFIKQASNKHWIDMKPYVLKPNAFYFTVPSQVHLKEESNPFTGTVIAFTEEFLALEENNTLRQLPIIQNPDAGHELLLSDADVLFIEDMLEKINTENNAGGNWQHGMLMGYMRVLMIYLSRLYVDQFSKADAAPERVLLKRYLSKIEENFLQHHEVSAYADMLNITAGHLSDVVKEQSGKPAIIHIHERLIMEARRLLFHTDYSVKEIAFRLGFEDASYFNRFFKRLVNETPVAYRTVIREMYH